MSPPLNKLQIASLKRMQKYRTEPPGLSERMRMASGFALVLLIPVLIAGALLVSIGFPEGMIGIAGLYVGAVAREIAQQRAFLSWFPITREITDWNKVDELAAAHPAPAPSKVRWAPAMALGVTGFVLLFGGAVAAERALAYSHDPRRNNPSDNVIILTTSWCPYCMSLRQHLADRGVHYTDLDIEKTTEGRWAHRAVNGRGIPITIVGDQVIRGLGEPGRQWSRVDAALKNAGIALRPEREKTL